jgi:FkbM family methyltransferase
MSQFKRQVYRYCDAYSVSRFDRLVLLAHYPLFKLMWLSDYGRPTARRIARRLVPFLRRYRLPHTVAQRTPEGVKRVRISLPFASSDFGSFAEVIWSEGYRNALQFGPFESIVDLGANTGLATLFFALRAGVRSALLVEANYELIDVARRNLAAVSHSTTIQIENVCISARDGGFTQFIISENHRHSRVDKPQPDERNVPSSGERFVNVPCRSLAGLLKQHSIRKIDLLKIDVEGAEHDLIDQPDAFASARVLIIEIHGSDEVRERFVQKLEAQHYEILERSSASGVPCEVVLAKHRD